GRASRHVVLHLLHPVCGLDRVASGIEGDALSNNGYSLVGVACWYIAEDDQLGGLGTALCNTYQGTHSPVLHSSLLQAIDFEADRLRHLAGASRELTRRHVVARLIDQLSSKVCCFSQNAAPLHSSP